MESKELIEVLYFLTESGYGDNTVWEILDEFLWKQNVKLN